MRDNNLTVLYLAEPVRLLRLLHQHLQHVRDTRTMDTRTMGTRTMTTTMKVATAVTDRVLPLLTMRYVGLLEGRRPTA